MSRLVIVTALVSAALVFRWLAPGLVTSLVENLASEPGPGDSLPGNTLWLYLAAGGLMVLILGHFRGWLGGGLEGED